MVDSVLGRALRQERRAIRRALGAGVLVALSTIGLAGTSAWLIVRAAQEPVVLSLTVPMGLVQLFALAKAAGRYVERTQTHRAALCVMGHVRASVARLLEPLVPAGLGPRSADVVDLVLRDVERVQDLLTAVAGPLLTSAVAGVAAVVVCGLVVPWSAAVLVVGLLATAVALPLGAARLGEASEGEMDRARKSMVDLFDDVAQGGDEYAMNAASRYLEVRLLGLEERLDVARRRQSLMVGVVNTLGTLVAGGCVIGAVVVTAIRLREGAMSPALIAVPALLCVSALELVGGIAPIMVGLRGDRVALGRLDSLGSLGPPVHDPGEPGPRVDRATSVHVEHVSQRYGEHAVLSDVSLHLEPGDVVVLSGPSAGGKTTLARQLAKFLDPTTGTLRIGDVDYPDLQSTQVRARVGFVDDAPHVFATTLAGNLRIAAPHASNDELLDACDAAGLSGLLASMPERLATELSGPATGLSGGEQRRLGVARELLAKRPIVIFDEPTAGLDEEAARSLLASIVDRYRRGAVVVISHRGDDLRVATRHLGLDDGVLVEVVPAQPDEVNR